MKKLCLWLGYAVSGLFLSACPSLVRAQSLDYGTLQGLFGEPITTSATGTPQRASEVAADMMIITSDQIRQSGSRNIPEILGIYVPGLNVLQEGIHAFDVGMRGYQQPYQPRLLVLVDGRQVFNDDYSRTAWDNLAVNIDDIRQIEVVKGASSALFGSNATGGVVNIITNSPLYDKSNTASVSVGTQNTLVADGTVTAKLADLGGIKVSAGGLDQKEFGTSQTAGDSSAGKTAPYHRYIAQNSEFKANSNLSFMTEMTYSENKDQQGVFIYAIDPTQSTSYSLRGGAAWQTPYGLIRSNTYFNHNYISLDAGQRGVIEVADQLVVSQLEDQFRIGTDHTFRVFLEYRNKQFDAVNSPVVVYERPDFASNTYSAGGTWLWQINDQWSWTNALRLDSSNDHMGGTLEKATYYSYKAYTQAYDTVAANSGLVYKMTDVDTLRATYGRGISDPSLVNSAFNNGLKTGPVSVLDYEGNPYLKPTIVENYGLDFEHKLSDISSTLKLSPYYEINRDLIANIVGAPRVVGGVVYVLKTPQNVGNSSGWGGEADLSGAQDGFRWDASYSYQTIRDANLVAQALDYAKSAPENQLRLNLGYTAGKWETDLHGQFVTSTDMLRLVSGSVPQEVATGSYYTIGGRIGYNVTDALTLALSGTNLTRSFTEESAYPAVERRVLLTLTGKF